MARTTSSEPPTRPLMTLRVSRDGGRTWTALREIWPDDFGLHIDVLSAWPPCLCPRHRDGSEISR